MPMPSIRIAAIQAAPAFLDLPGSLDRLADWTRRAAGEGAKLVAFGETWLSGYPAWLDMSPGAALWAEPAAQAVFLRLMDNSVAVPGPATVRLGEIAQANGVVLVVGVHERVSRSLFNTLLILGPDGALLNHHRKLIPTYSERLIWGHGDAAGLHAVETPIGRVGGMVCWEHWMPLARQAMHDSVEDFHVALWPGVQEMHQVASRHYAFEGRCFVLAVGSLLRLGDMPRELPVAERYQGPAEKLAVAGGSIIVGPDGKILAGPCFEEEKILLADCDLTSIRREALTLDVSGHYSRPDLFDFRVSRRDRPTSA
ncbi:MAG TPA: carbon-nitrogen hydrolase family protein [Gemmatimonadales bacterium]|nr:carbon-nitrogen hydrolase family protein [Gemmatimonadales bacterium]